MKIKGMIASAAAIAVAALSAGSAQAAQYMVSYTSDPSNSFSGLFTTTDVANSAGFFTVISLTGQRNGFAASLLPVNSYNGNDNLFKPTSTYFDSNGVAFSVGGVSYNPYYSSFNGLREYTGSGTNPITNFTVSNVGGAVPEPASWAMMILGMGAVGEALRRRAKVSTRVSFAG